MGREQGADLLSDEIQREKIEAWAKYRDLRIVGWYVDLDVSGRKGVKRPEFERMMADAAAGKFETIAVYRLTRFARSVQNAATAVDELEQHGVTLVSVTEDIDTGTVAGNLLRNILFALAEFESERISEEWKNVHANRRRRGIAHVARPMLGYRIDKAEIAGIEDAEAAAVRLMYDERLRGAGYGQIRGALWRQGHRPKQGGTFFALSSIRDVLHNPLYGGLVRLADGELVEAVHEAIVPREKWEAVQAAGRRASKINRHSSTRLLSGLIVCSGCGAPMRYEQQKGRAVYRCRTRQSGSEWCETPVAITADAADAYVEDRFRARFDPRRMPHGGRLKRTRQQADWMRRAQRAKQRVEELDRALDAIADQRFVKGSLEAAEYQRQFARYSAEREQRLEEAEDLERLAQTVAPIERDVLALWPRLAVEVKKRALRLQVDRIEVQPARVRGGSHARGIEVRERLQIAWIS